MDLKELYAQIQAETTQWAKDAKQCECCKAWALLDENGHCSSCPTSPHKHPQIVVILDGE